MNAAVSSGATLVLHERFHPDEILESIKSNRVSMFFGVPVVYSRFLSIPKIEEYFRDVRYCFTAAAPMPVSTVRLWREKVGKTIHEGYGLTEASPVVCINPFFAPKQGTVGLPLPSTEVTIRDDHGTVLPIGETGEICVRGPQVMLGYWQRPEQTKQVLGADGWLHTGDIGAFDPDGFLRLLDRKKDMINVSGLKAFPSEVEDVATQFPGVHEAAAIGVPDPHSGETVKLFVVRSDPALDKAELTKFMHARLAGYKVPTIIEFVDSLPKSNIGKILRKDLR